VELVGYSSAAFLCAVDDNRHEKGLPLGHVTLTFDRQSPFATEVTLIACLRVHGDHRDKQPTVVNLLADLAVPGIATAQLALVEPDLDAGSTERSCDALSGLRIF
jgi:hypothetical protein